MFHADYERDFAKWWHYYFLKELYGYTAEQMKEISDYRPGSHWAEMGKLKAYSYYRKNNDHER